MESFVELPKDLPVPIDDGACNHLLNQALPSMLLSSTQGRDVDLSAISGRVVIYCYPMTGKPNVSLPEGWDQIPGARGCTPQSCAFRDHYQELEQLGTQVYGGKGSEAATKCHATATKQLQQRFQKNFLLFNPPKNP
jgi:peroxiredoxin